MDIALSTSIASLLVILLEALKKGGLPSRFAPLVNVIAATCAALAVAYCTGHFTDPTWILTSAVTIAGSAAVGYDTVKGIQDK